MHRTSNYNKEGFFRKIKPFVLQQVHHSLQPCFKCLQFKNILKGERKCQQVIGVRNIFGGGMSLSARGDTLLPEKVPDIFTNLPEKIVIYKPKSMEL